MRRSLIARRASTVDARHRHRLRRAAGVDLGFELIDRLSAGSEQLVGDAPADAEHRQIPERAGQRVRRPVGSDLRVGRAARLARRPMRRRLLHHQNGHRTPLANDFRLPPVVGVHGVEPAHEAALRIALLRFVIQHHHDLAGDVDAGEVVVLVLGCGDAIAGEHQRRVDRDVGIALARHREVGAERVVAARGAATGGRRAEARAQERGAAVDLRLGHREILEVGAVVADRLQLVAMIEPGDVLRRDASFSAERIAPRHLVRGEKVQVALQRVGTDRLQAGIVVREQNQGQRRDRRGEHVKPAADTPP